MSLFIDGPPSTIEDLRDQDSGLLEVSRIDQLDLSTKLRLAHRELGLQLSELFEQQHSFYAYSYQVNPITLRCVVITPSLKAWHALHTLELVYRDLYFNQLNDRFQAKWKEYRDLSVAAKHRFREIGAGFVADPLPKPAGPKLATTPAAEIGGAFYVSVTTVNKAGEESAPSESQSILLPDGNAIDVQLNPAPENAQGWNVYVGANPDNTYLQNDTPIALGSNWIFFPSALIVGAVRPRHGQLPAFLRPLPRLLQRG